MTIVGLREMDIESTLVQSITVSDLERELRDIGPHSIKYLWTPTEIALMREYVPSTYHRIAEELGKDTSEDPDERKRRLAFQIQSEVVNKSSTLDSGIIHGKRDEGTVSSKIYNLGRICSILQIIGIDSSLWTPEQIRRTDDLDDTMIEIKLQFANILRAMPEWAAPVATVNKHANLNSEQKQKFGYVDDILKIVGDDAVAIAAYGSSVKESDPKNYSDYDNFLVVKPHSLGRIYPQLKGRKFEHKDGKHVGLNLIEEGVFTKFIRLNHDPNEYLTHCTVLHGQLNFPVVSEREVKERGTSYSVLRSKALKSACSWIARNPELLLDKKDLFDYFQKTLLFITQSALNSTEGVEHRSKDVLMARLAEAGGEVLPFKPDRDYVLDATYRAAASSTQLLERFYGGKKFGNGFVRA